MLNSLQTTGALVTTNVLTTVKKKKKKKKKKKMSLTSVRPPGLDPAATPSYVQHLAAFQTQLRQVEESCRQSHQLRERIVGKDDIESTTAAAAADKKVQRKIINLRQAAQTLSQVNFEAKAKEIEGVMEGFFVPSQRALSMFDPATWSKCFTHFWFGAALPNMDRPRKITFEQILLCLLDRSELE